MIAVIIFTFISFMSIIFIFHALGSLGNAYSSYINIFLFFLALMESLKTNFLFVSYFINKGNGFWSNAKYNSGQMDASKMKILNDSLTAFVIYFQLILTLLMNRYFSLLFFCRAI